MQIFKYPKELANSRCRGTSGGQACEDVLGALGQGFNVDTFGASISEEDSRRDHPLRRRRSKITRQPRIPPLSPQANDAPIFDRLSTWHRSGTAQRSTGSPEWGCGHTQVVITRLLLKS